MFNNHMRSLVIGLLVAIVILLVVQNGNRDPNRLSYNSVIDGQPEARSKVYKLRTAVDDWLTCYKQKIGDAKSDYDKLWAGMQSFSNECTASTPISVLQLSSVVNKDEVKHHIFSQSTDPSVIITLGVGNDITAEQHLKEKLPAGSEFFGADPIYNPNGDLYTKIGTFFPLAISEATGRSNASVLVDGRYSTLTMTHVDMGTFITKMVNRTKIDHLLMDNEGPEYELFPLMSRGKLFDQLGVTICQLNVEFHQNPKEATERRADFLALWNTMLAEGRFLPLHVHSVGHQRVYLANVEDSWCTGKYLEQFF